MVGALIEGAIKRRKVVLAITFILSLFGLWAYLTLPREADPDITVPFIYIVVPYPGVSPEDAERLLVRPMERQLQSLQGLKEMNARAIEGAAIVTLEFEVNFDKNKVLEDVRAKVDLARGRFPPDALPPDIEEENVSDNPSIGIVLFGQAPERAMTSTALSLKQRLEALPGVLRADISGGREEMMEVTIDPVRMEAYGVSATDLAQVIARNNQLIAAGQNERYADEATKSVGAQCGPMSVTNANERPAPCCPTTTNGSSPTVASTSACGLAMTLLYPAIVGQSPSTAARIGWSPAIQTG